MHACASCFPVWSLRARTSGIRATGQQGEAVTDADNNCVIYVVTGKCYCLTSCYHDIVHRSRINPPLTLTWVAGTRSRLLLHTAVRRLWLSGLPPLPGCCPRKRKRTRAKHCFALNIMSSGPYLVLSIPFLFARDWVHVWHEADAMLPCVAMSARLLSRNSQLELGSRAHARAQPATLPSL
jgi:hypothetical protein